MYNKNISCQIKYTILNPFFQKNGLILLWDKNHATDLQLYNIIDFKLDDEYLYLFPCYSDGILTSLQFDSNKCLRISLKVLLCQYNVRCCFRLFGISESVINCSNNNKYYYLSILL